jgi:hypothetical protein
MTVSDTGTDVTLRWTSSSLTTIAPLLHYDFQLETSPDLIVWAAAGASIPGGILTTNSVDHNLSIPKSSGTEFFRLRCTLNVPGANLTGANLSDTDLQGANLSGATLAKANLAGANLSGANLSGAQLAGANLAGTILTQVSLDGLDLCGVDLVQIEGRPLLTRLDGDPAADVATLLPHLAYNPDSQDIAVDDPDMGSSVFSRKNALVVLKAGTTAGQLNSLLTKYGATIVGSAPKDAILPNNLVLLRCTTQSATQLWSVVEALKQEPPVSSAAPDLRLKFTAIPNDSNGASPLGPVAPCVSCPTIAPPTGNWTWQWDAPGHPDGGNWGLEYARVPQMWNWNDAIRKRASRITTAIIDGGFPGHPDLLFSQIYGSSNFHDPDHGLHVSGIIGATFGNTNGVDGVNPFARLVGCTTYEALFSAYLAVWEVVHFTPDVQVINLSEGFDLGIFPNYAVLRPFLETAMAMHGELFAEIAAVNPSVEFVCGAGNYCDQIPVRLVSPWCYAAIEVGEPNIVVVGSHGPTGAQSTFSESGAHVNAPGEAILSTVTNGLYDVYCGTSMSSPFVAGIVGYLRALDPNLSSFNIKTLLQKNGPNVDAFTSVMEHDTLRNNPDMLKLLLDIDDGTPDGNERVAVDPAKPERDRAFDPVTGLDSLNEDADGDGGIGNGVIDMGDFRRWRDWLLFGEGGHALNGSPNHIKNDANRDGKVDPNNANEIKLYPRGDFNGDGIMDRTATRAVPGWLKGVSTTDLGVLINSGLWEDRFVTNVLDLPNLIDSVDLSVSAANFYHKNPQFPPADVTVYDTLTKQPYAGIGRPFSFSTNDSLHIFTVPVGNKYYVASAPISLGDGSTNLMRSIGELEVSQSQRGADYAVDLTLVEMTARANVENPTEAAVQSRPDQKEVDAYISGQTEPETDSAGARAWANDQATLYAVANAAALTQPPTDPSKPSTYTAQVAWQRSFVKNAKTNDPTYDIKPMVLRLADTTPPGTEWSALAEISLEMRAYDRSPTWLPVFFYHGEIAGQSKSGGQPATFHIVRQEGNLPDAKLKTNDASADYVQVRYPGKINLAGIPDGHSFELRYRLIASVVGRGIDSVAYASIGDPLHYGSGLRMVYGSFGDLPSISSFSVDSQNAAHIGYSSRTNFYYLVYRGTNVETAGMPVAMKLGTNGPDELIDPNPPPGADQNSYIVENQPIDQPLDVDGDGIDDVYELLHPKILNPLNTADARLDADGDGRSNLQEYLDGTNPELADADPVVAGNEFPAQLFDLGLSGELQIADVNADGHPDIVGLDTSSRTIGTTLGNPNATFQPALSSPAPNAGFLGGYTLANLNADKFPDALVVNQSSNIVEVLLGDGSGKFTPGQSFPVGKGSIRVSTGDVNNDGKLDALVVNEFGHSISVLLGNGDGTFQAHQDADLKGLTPSDVALGQLDSDSLPDLVVALPNNSQVGVLRGNGNGTFGAMQTYATGSGPRRVAVGDLNGDGKADIVTSDLSGNGISVLINKGDGTFQSKVDYPTGELPQDLTLVDLDKDGDLDVVVGHLTSTYNAILLNDGHGVFAAQTPAFTSNTGTALLADFNSDGRLDLLTPLSSGPFLSLGIGSAAFDTATEVSVPGLFPTDLEIADINGDGVKDLLVANANASTIEVILGHTGGSFTYDHPIPIGPQVQALTSAKLHGGTVLDLAVVTIRPDFSPGNASNQLHVLVGNGAGSFQAQPVIPLTDRPSDVVAADINGDGNMDLLVLFGGAGQIAPFFGQGNGSFTAGPLLNLGGPTFSIQVADLNGDGRADLVAAPSVGSGGFIRVYFGGSDGSLTLGQEITPTGSSSALSMALQDMNGDGHLDLVAIVVGRSGQRLVVYVADSKGAFGAEQTLLNDAFGPVITADINGDGRPDIINGSQILLANGTLTFDPPQSYWTGGGFIRVQDVNGDGRADIVTAVASSKSVRIQFQR